MCHHEAGNESNSRVSFTKLANKDDDSLVWKGSSGECRVVAASTAQLTVKLVAAAVAACQLSPASLLHALSLQLLLHTNLS
jgi:hypothetical protein